MKGYLVKLLRYLPLFRCWHDQYRGVKQFLRVNPRLNFLKPTQILPPVHILNRSTIHLRIRIIDVHPPVRWVKTRSRAGHPSVQESEFVVRVRLPGLCRKTGRRTACRGAGRMSLPCRILTR